MKKIGFVLLIVVFITNISFAVASEKEIILPVGTGNGYIAYSEDAELRGLKSFAVSGSKIYILDSMDNQVEIFDRTGTYIDTIQIGNRDIYTDIAVGSNGHVYLLTYTGSIYEYGFDLKRVKEPWIVKAYREIDYGFHQLYKNKNNRIVLRDIVSYKETDIETKEVNNGFEGFQLDQPLLNDMKHKSVTISDKKYSFEHIVSKETIVYPISYTFDTLVLHEFEALLDLNIQIENRFTKFTNGKVEYALAQELSRYYVIPYKYLTSNEDGDVFQIIPLKDKIIINELEFMNKRESKLIRAIDFKTLNYYWKYSKYGICITIF